MKVAFKEDKMLDTEEMNLQTKGKTLCVCGGGPPGNGSVKQTKAGMDKHTQKSAQMRHHQTVMRESARNEGELATHERATDDDQEARRETAAFLR